MRISGNAGVTRFRTAVSAASGVLLLGAASVPAYAGSARSEQWHLDAMKAEEMWKTSTGDGVTVAIIDTGVDAKNPDLVGQVLKGLNLEHRLPGDEFDDYSGHGTGMAGLIAGTGRAAGGNGAFGLAPRAKILPIRLPDGAKAANQAAADQAFHKSASRAIRYAVDQGAKVVNISQGVTTGSDELTAAVEYAWKKGALIFASAGNSGDAANLVEYPAGTPGVVGVGAIGKNLHKTEESEYGPQVDLAAPGDEMIHACGGATGFCESHGTSDATALASASAALIWSKHPDWTNNQVLRVMLNTAGGPTSGAKRNDYVGYGVVRPRIALKTPGDPGPADVYPLPDLAEAASPPAKASEEPTGSAGAAGEKKPAAMTPAAAEGTNSTTLWPGLGVGAAAIVGAVIAALTVRSRRRKAAVPEMQPHGPSHSYQQQPSYPAYGPPPGAPGPNSPYGGTPGQGPNV
ncbi:type VII secretion-associated serine protease mycosin [Streptomyces sp. NPDC005318]|uniref:type VII secretion-associated serine protease mycosin n=1 Tax=Streptomyces sp. NPDC005318 TaxID=3157031 RepID=UPI0033A525C1